MNKTITSFGIFFLFLASFKVAQAMDESNAQAEALQKKALFMAAAANNADQCKHMILEGCNPNFCAQEGFSPLSFAASLGANKSLKALLEYHADPNFHAPGQELPVIHAIKNKNTLSTLILFLHGATLPIGEIDICELAGLSINSIIIDFAQFFLGYNPAHNRPTQGMVKRSTEHLQQIIQGREAIAKILVFFGYRPEEAPGNFRFNIVFPEQNIGISPHLQKLEQILTEPDYVKNHPEEFEFIRDFQLRDAMDRETNKKNLVHYLQQREIGQR